MRTSSATRWPSGHRVEATSTPRGAYSELGAGHGGGGGGGDPTYFAENPLVGSRLLIAIEIFIDTPLKWVAIIDRDPDTYTYLPNLDRDYQSRSKYLHQTPYTDIFREMGSAPTHTLLRQRTPAELDSEIVSRRSRASAACAGRSGSSRIGSPSQQSLRWQLAAGGR